MRLGNSSRIQKEPPEDIKKISVSPGRADCLDFLEPAGFSCSLRLNSANPFRQILLCEQVPKGQ